MESKPGDLEGLKKEPAKAVRTEDGSVPETTASTSAPVDDAPDPDEDDLDDLDGELI